jgi:hypothetical protein
MLVRAGYDPNAAANVWFANTSSGRPEDKTARVNSRRRNELRQQSFGRSLVEARTVYQHNSAKIGAGNALAFTAVRTATPAASQQVNQTALEWVSPQALTAPPVTKAAAAVPLKPTLPGSNNVVVSSDGEFLPPTMASTRPGEHNWSAAPSAPEPPVIEQTSYEQPQGPAFGPALP